MKPCGYVNIWEPRWTGTLEAGLDKLQDYIYLIWPVPAYTLAMGQNVLPCFDTLVLMLYGDQLHDEA